MLQLLSAGLGNDDNHGLGTILQGYHWATDIGGTKSQVWFKSMLNPEHLPAHALLRTLGSHMQSCIAGSKGENFPIDR